MKEKEKEGESEGKTYFVREGGVLEEMKEPTEEGLTELRRMYAIENRSDERVSYAQKFNFSMNKGDYTAPIYHHSDEFLVFNLPLNPLTINNNNNNNYNPFTDLTNDVYFEPVLKGRQGTVLLHPHPTRGNPIVRTTTKYTTPAQPFLPPHLRLCQAIEEAGSLPCKLNNALVEIYNNQYATMGYHSDQAQDLLDGSHVAVFSCYKDPERAKQGAKPPRKLVVELKEREEGKEKEKEKGKKGGEDGEVFEIPMGHNSVIFFSMETNRRFKHKIVLAQETKPKENEWLGFTLRTSGTYIKVEKEKEKAFFEDGRELRVAANNEAQNLYKLRGRENKEVDFVYPDLDYTLSVSDTMEVKKWEGEEGEKEKEKGKEKEKEKGEAEKSG